MSQKKIHTRDVNAVIFYVHLMQPSFDWRILDSNSAVLIVRDVRLGNLARWHSDFTFNLGETTVRVMSAKRRDQPYYSVSNL